MGNKEIHPAQHLVNEEKTLGLRRVPSKNLILHRLSGPDYLAGTAGRNLTPDITDRWGKTLLPIRAGRARVKG